MGTAPSYKGFEINVVCEGSLVNQCPTEWSCAVRRNGMLIYTGPTRKSEGEALADGLAWVDASLLAGASRGIH